ncbi:IS30 family transposase [Lactobacillus crispatus]|uniref:IS30 family transposase n=1 Tax=Lactobacillus crispatus TaxID=47770 RepID=UPI0029C333C2|nr:IS30 family transposase [Lactobacillus crispatus]MDX5061308.1 IS30 family transposase [Lactobacillus crispatus]MDX5073473.1 IS30 family transposase [Lactobacillus crispatus]MDX5076962.1 IS30 family transposase [Lactobacillus crispatus]MDX5088520.1 IS30 family transposase [Lactobacillus crispatus]MDX5090342.1 IS30 family transposase [Lactobacillus crispatus]
MTNSNSSISKHYHQLTSVQRGQIQAMLDSGITSRTVIAQEVGCHKSTISREIKRGSVLQRDSSYLLYEHYYADTAQIYYEKRRKNCYQRNPLKHYAVFLRMLSRRFKAKFDATSIDEFVGEFKRTMPGYPCPSTPTAYRYIDQGLVDISNIDLPMKLKRRRNKRHHSHGGHALHKKQPVLMTLTERTTRFEVVIKIPDYRASTCQRLLQKEIDRHPDWFKSITFDNGSEFADMTKIKGCQIYFAHPYSPWERGTNENCNGLLRQFFPKGKSMKDKSKAYVQQATNAINHKYRRILQYQTAEELFKQYISS